MNKQAEKNGLVIVGVGEEGKRLLEYLPTQGITRTDYIMEEQNELREQYVKDGYVLIYVGDTWMGDRLPEEGSIDLTGDRLQEVYIHAGGTMGTDEELCDSIRYICALVSEAMIQLDIYDLKQVVKQEQTRLLRTGEIPADKQPESVCNLIDGLTRQWREAEKLLLQIVYASTEEISLVEAHDLASAIQDQVPDTDLVFGVGANTALSKQMKAGCMEICMSWAMK